MGKGAQAPCPPRLATPHVGGHATLCPPYNPWPHLRILAAQNARVLKAITPQKSEGAGKAGCWLHPRPRAQEISTRVRHHRFNRSDPAFPARSVLTAASRSPWCAGLVSHHHQRGHRPADLISASGDQDHTTSPSAFAAFVNCAESVHRIPHNVRDDAYAPLCGRDARRRTTDLPDGASEYFCADGVMRRSGLRSFEN